MIRFEFKDETQDEHARTVIVEIPHTDYHLDSVLGFMADFLRGVGYVIDGNLEVVEENPYKKFDPKNVGEAVAYVATDSKSCSGKCCGN